MSVPATNSNRPHVEGGQRPVRAGAHQPTRTQTRQAAQRVALTVGATESFEAEVAINRVACRAAYSQALELVKTGDPEGALVIARSLLTNKYDPDVKRYYAEIFLAVGEKYLQQEEYGKARRVFLEAKQTINEWGETTNSHLFTAPFPYNLTGDLYDGNDNVTLQPNREGERPFTVEYVDNRQAKSIYLAVTYQEIVSVKYAQATFLLGANGQVTDPYDLEQVKDYFSQIVSPGALRGQITNYLKGFYFHPGGNMPDNLSASAVATLPTDKFGRKPADCSFFVTLAAAALEDREGLNLSQIILVKLVGDTVHPVKHLVALFSFDNQTHLLVNNNEIVVFNANRADLLGEVKAHFVKKLTAFYGANPLDWPFNAVEKPGEASPYDYFVSGSTS